MTSRVGEVSLFREAKEVVASGFHKFHLTITLAFGRERFSFVE